MIDKGSCWRVGSRVNFDVIKDRWLDMPSTFKVADPPFLPDGIKVIDLRRARGSWDSDFVNQLFKAKDVLHTLSFPNGSFEHEDLLV